MNIREYKTKDNEEIYNIFYEAVHSIAETEYSINKLNSWAKKNIDLNKWCEKFKNCYTLVAEENNKIIGFSNISEDGYLNNIYIAKNFQNKRIATQFLNLFINYLKTKNKSYIMTYSSVNARYFFEKSGFAVLENNILIKDNEELENFLMKKEF